MLTTMSVFDMQIENEHRTWNLQNMKQQTSNCVCDDWVVFNSMMCSCHCRRWGASDSNSEDRQTLTKQEQTATVQMVNGPIMKLVDSQTGLQNRIVDHITKIIFSFP